MGLGIGKLKQAFDRFLRVEDVATKTDAIHVRAVGISALVFAVAQCFNFTLLSLQYDKYSSHQSISIGAILFSLVAFITLRYVKKSIVYVIMLSVGIILAVLATAVPGELGIHTATLPYLIMGVVAASFIGKWYYNFVFSTFAMAVIWGLYLFSFQLAVPHNIPSEIYNLQLFQRASQCSLALIMTSCVAGCYMFMT